MIKRLFSAFKQLSLKKKLLLIGALVIAVIIAIFAIGQATQKPAYTMTKVERSDIVETVSETGTIATAGRANVYSPTHGIVQAVMVKNGDVVTAGQELFTVTSSASVQEKQAALANYLAAKASLDDANAGAFSLRSSMYDAWDSFFDLSTGDRYEHADGTPKLDERNDAEFQRAQDDWRAAEIQYKEQQTAVGAAQAQTTSAWHLYQATQNATITAPLAGTVTNLAITTGSSVQANLVGSPAQPVVVMTTQATTEAIVPLSESDIAKVADGQEVIIDVTAVDDHDYIGVVKRVDTIGTITGGVNRYNAYIELTNADDKIRAGMTLDADITTKKLENVLSVPNGAVKLYQGSRAVRVVDPKTNQITYIPVEIGIRGAEKTQILSGIEEGRDVILTLTNEQLKRPGLFGN